VDVKSISVFREAVGHLRVAGNIHTHGLWAFGTLAEAYERLLQFKGCPHYCGGSCDVTITAAAVMSFLLSPAGLSRTMVLGLKYSPAKKSASGHPAVCMEWKKHIEQACWKILLLQGMNLWFKFRRLYDMSGRCCL
jgi:hypothetical protein